MYLNTIYFGEGAYGARGGGANLLREVARTNSRWRRLRLLAGLPQQPSRLNPYNNPEAARSSAGTKSCSTC